MAQYIVSETTPSGIHITKTGHNGPAAVIVAGVHGNEQGAQDGLKRFIQSLKDGNVRLAKGQLILVENANPEACIQGVRCIDSDLARNINVPKVYGYEAAPAAELKNMVDMHRPDLLLDLHTMGGETVFDPQNPLHPFGFMDHPDNGILLAAAKIPKSVTGWIPLHGQENDLAMYVQSLGGKGLVVELGHHHDPASAANAWWTIVRILRFMDMIHGDYRPVPEIPSLLPHGKKASEIHLVARIPTPEGARFAKAGFHNFMEVKPGQTITKVGDEPGFTVPEDGSNYVLVMPKTDNQGNITVPPGHTCALLGRVTTQGLHA